MLLCRPPKLFTQDSKVKFHPKSVNSDETSFDNKFVIYHTKVKSTAVFLHDTSMIPPFPLLFFGGSISVDRDGDQQIIAVDNWIKFQAPHHIAKLVKVCFYSTNPHGHVIVSIYTIEHNIMVCACTCTCT